MKWNVNVSRTTALHCLPALLCESDSEVFKTCNLERESRNPGVLIGPVCIFAIISDDEDAVSLQPHQFEDPDFGGQLCNLSSIHELQNMGTVKLIRDCSTTSNYAGTSDSGETDSCLTPQRESAWPDVFVVPNFPHDIEFALREGNEAKEPHGKRLTLNKEQKLKIIEGMARAIFEYKVYPCSKEIKSAAEALVQKHPCLEESGSKSGCDGWRDSLVFKIGNFRHKLGKSVCPEVKVNSGKRRKSSPDGDSPHSKIKRPRRAEVNFLPQLPQGETEESLERLREGTSQDPAAIKRPAAIISVIDDDGDVAAVPLHPGRVYVVLEEKVVMKDFRCWPDALVCLYGLMYSLQHKYPNCMKNTFGFIQKVLLNLDRDRMKPKVLALKNQL
ncbi:unnamed protein product [Coregonus sp. 'balchen']|nr:unnamed protein product [Coregonus sp. 'balchen']